MVDLSVSFNNVGSGVGSGVGSAGSPGGVDGGPGGGPGGVGIGSVGSGVDVDSVDTTTCKYD